MRHSFTDVLNHFTDLLDKNRAALPSSLLLKSQKAVINLIQKRHDFFPPSYQYTKLPTCQTQSLMERHTVWLESISETEYSKSTGIHTSQQSHKLKTNSELRLACGRLMLCGTLPTTPNLFEETDISFSKPISSEPNSCLFFTSTVCNSLLYLSIWQCSTSVLPYMSL